MVINQPKIFVISAPSGTGKTTIIKKAIDTIPTLRLSVSHTTRDPRSGEIDGEDYFFVTKDEFKTILNSDGFLEWAEVHGNYYGTSIEQVNQLVSDGKTVILDIDVQGAMQVRQKSDISATYLFIEPPSIETLRARLSERGTESSASLEKRLRNAEKELAFKDQYDYVIMNDDLVQAVEKFEDILLKES